MRSVPPRLRAPVSMLVGGAVIAAVAVPAHGWGTLVTSRDRSPSSWQPGGTCAGGRDSDFGALIRDKADERQAYRRLKTQALVGIVMSVAVGVAYLAALAAKATLWPLGILIFVPGVTFIVGWAIYREPGGGQDESPGDRITGLFQPECGRRGRTAPDDWTRHCAGRYWLRLTTCSVARSPDATTPGFHHRLPGPDEAGGLLLPGDRPRHHGGR